LPGDEREEEEEGRGGRWSQPAERECFSFSDAFKTYPTPWEGRPRRFPPNNEQVGRGRGGSQPGEGGLVHPQATYISPKLFLLPACLTFIYVTLLILA
jgi:hypothetical protein